MLAHDVSGRTGAVFEALTERAARALRSEGFAESEHRFARSADLRYRGQAFEVRVPVGEDPDAAVAEFHDAHERLYGYCFRDKPEQRVEWVNLRVTGIGPIARPALRTAAPRAGGAAAPTGVRRVLFDESYVDTPTYHRD